VVTHAGTRGELSRAKKEDLVASLKSIAPPALQTDPASIIVCPKITFTANFTLYLGQHTFQMINMPGHTASIVDSARKRLLGVSQWLRNISGLNFLL